jgi:hypothetical protein
MRIKFLAFDGTTDEYNVQGYCGHIITIPLQKWSSQEKDWVHCDQCEAEYKLVERMLHLMYERKVKFMEENE